MYLADRFFRTSATACASKPAAPTAADFEQFVAEISPVIFDPAVMAKRTVQSGDVDLIRASANNYYGEGVTQVEVEDFYARMKAAGDFCDPAKPDWGYPGKLDWTQVVQVNP